MRRAYAAASALATRAIDRGALAPFGVLECAPAHLARRAGATVDVQLLLEIAGFAIRVDEIAQRGAAALDGVGEDGLDRVGQRRVSLARNAAGLARWMDAGAE